jgi:hypothetical protein
MALLRMAARTADIAGTAGAVQHRQQQRWDNKAAEQQAQAQQQYAAPPPQAYAPPPQAAPASDTSSQLAEIEKLGELKAKGLLTEEEFSAKKAQILGL